METWETVLPGVDYVFHLAAREYYYRSGYDPTGYDPKLDLRSNVSAGFTPARSLSATTLSTQIVFASSANLYGVVDTLPVNEESRDNPLTAWAIHKLMAEHYFDCMHKNLV